jgi:hypothetical protein
MRETLQEILQLGEWGGLFAFIGIVLFYALSGKKDETRVHYRNVMIFLGLIYALCAFILRVLDF